ncbi:E3 ubiquitin-protein ligase CBL-C [Hemicordylus capensis]|uniref:E3 ubiquitin-protein ligase CBL-C n=1 Tax=Hemicordylus capensis TaxID=884348 RepID=UPI002303EB6B|nr:E3 ubiquitin-protein ligase CBL-C [Hemicordylus capensis]XP_053124027.1 E3 ubiquitin-protein ligase CBL-C [Hemicordylus capensis]
MAAPPWPAPASLSLPRWVSAHRALDKALQKLSKLHQLVSQPHLGLRNSPPHLPYLLPQTHQHLRVIREAYGAGIAQLWEEGYFRIFLTNLLEKVKQAERLFKRQKGEVFQEQSAIRRNLTKLSLIFSHMLAELKALFPDGRDHGGKYQLSKPEAQTFWRETWGTRSLVSWAEFREGLHRVHPVDSGSMAIALRSTIDLTCNGHISIFEFDVFTCLFQPWRTLLKNWTYLAVTHPGYMAFLTYDEVKARLQAYSSKPGSYIFRLSCTRLGQWAIGYVMEDGSILQTIPQNKPLFQALIDGQKEGFYVYPDGKNTNPDLKELIELSQNSRIQVSQEQFELYCQVGSTFQLCKICAENDKDVRIQPCGHLLCRGCLEAWQLSEAHTCPFCRCKIWGHEDILIDPFSYTEDRPGLEEEGDEEDLEDVEAVLQQLAVMRKDQGRKNSTPTPSLDPETLQTPPVPPRLDLLQRQKRGSPPSADYQGSAHWIHHRPLPSLPEAGPTSSVPWDAPQASTQQLT